MQALFSIRWVFRILLLAVMLGLSVARTAQANIERNDAVAMFYTDLSPYGNWEEHPVYGKVWYPRDIPADWNPYTLGYWVNTEAYGWLWVAESDWGTITEHYGRWTLDDRDRWFWVPGTIWAPAWVIWREGEDEIGTAPMPPYWNPYDIVPVLIDSLFSRCWVFVHKHDFPHHAHHHSHNQNGKPKPIYIDPRRNPELLRRTHVLEPSIVLDRHIFNRGVSPEKIERATGRRVVTVNPKVLSDSSELATQNKRAVKEDAPIIYRPIDNPLTLDAIHDEELRAKGFAVKITQLSEAPKEATAAEQTGEPKQPDRHDGKVGRSGHRGSRRQTEMPQPESSLLDSAQGGREPAKGEEKIKAGYVDSQQAEPKASLPREDSLPESPRESEASRQDPDPSSSGEASGLNGSSLSTVSEPSPASSSVDEPSSTPAPSSANGPSLTPPASSLSSESISTPAPSSSNESSSTPAPSSSNESSSTPASSPSYDSSSSSSPSTSSESSSSPSSSTSSESSSSPSSATSYDSSSSTSSSTSSESSSTPSSSPSYESSSSSSSATSYDSSSSSSPSTSYDSSSSSSPSTSSESSSSSSPSTSYESSSSSSSESSSAPTPAPVSEPSPPLPPPVESHPQESTSSSSSSSSEEHKHEKKHHD